MVYMEKRFYLFDDIVSGGKTFKNFTAGRKLPKSLVNDSSLYVSIELADNEKLEYLSLTHYNTMNYWDLLLLLNNMSDINSLPKDMDSLINSIEEELLSHILYFNIANTDENEAYIRATRAEIEERLTNENEKHRSFKIIKPTRITDFLSRLDDYTATLDKGL